MMFPVMGSGQISNKIYKGLEINYIVLNAADIVITFRNLDRGAKEANPLGRFVMKSRPVAVAVKAGATIGILASLRFLKKESKTEAFILLGVLNVVYSFLLKSNIKVAINL